jgi:hypothetical protein
MKRGEFSMPIEICPPCMGTFTMKDLFMICSIDSVLTSNTKIKTKKKTLSVLENTDRALFIFVSSGNLPVILNWRIRL